MLRRRVVSVRALCSQQRDLKTLSVRKYMPLFHPVEFRFYQRFTNNPRKQSGVQFLTHFETHQRWRVQDQIVDFLHWGKENGLAHMPHRHQRVAFDFYDTLHPTNLPDYAPEDGWFEGQDPTFGSHPSLTRHFDPNVRPWSTPMNYNTAFVPQRGQNGEIRLGRDFSSNNLAWDVFQASDTLPQTMFGNAEIKAVKDGVGPRPLEVDTAHPTGRTPGIHAPFLGEHDSKMMHAMARPVNERNTVCRNDGRFSRNLYLNRPQKNQTLDEFTICSLDKHIDRATNNVMGKLSLLTSSQSGITDAFCMGLDFEVVAHDMSMRFKCQREAENLEIQRDNEKHLRRKKSLDIAVQAKRAEADQYLSQCDSLLRSSVLLLWRVFSANRPFMTLINGKCRNVGCGLALFSRFPALRDSSEFYHDGLQVGLTPFGGMTHLLARSETSLKYPGLAEFVMLVGAPLYAGDALRLGWSDLFTTLPDMDFHIKEWFDNTEHLHNDAVAWQLGHLLETCFMMKSGHSTALERTALSPIRARWIEDVFADQPSVEAILDTLSEIEKMAFIDSNNTKDVNLNPNFTLESVSHGIRKLKNFSMHFSLAPWDITPPEEEIPLTDQQLAAFFREYYFERKGGVNVASHKYGDAVKKWRRFRQKEFEEYQRARNSAFQRHVFVRLEGCEGILLEFDFEFIGNQTSSEGTTTEQPRNPMLGKLQETLLLKLGMPHREMQLMWFLPTFDCAPIKSDGELQDILRFDPGIENGREFHEFPPLYLQARRQDIFFSEWAFAVKHQLLLVSPFALKASFQLLNDVRGDGSDTTIQSVSESLATEFRYLARLIQRPDFFRIGMPSSWAPTEWQEREEKLNTYINESDFPLRPIAHFDDVFHRNVQISGHTFLLRPKWHPNKLEDVNQNEIAALKEELSFSREKLTEVYPPPLCERGSSIIESVNEVGLEVVPHLGTDKVEPLKPNASVPQNVNFYRMARHPWLETESSWRIDGFTEGSEDLFVRKYKEAEKALYDSSGTGSYNYWPSQEAVDEVLPDSDGDLLRDRFWNVVKSAEGSVEAWARELRSKATTGKLSYTPEILTADEKIFNDDFYRWFIVPGEHPNPSGVLRFGTKALSAKTKSILDDFDPTVAPADIEVDGEKVEVAEPAIITEAEVVDENADLN